MKDFGGCSRTQSGLGIGVKYGEGVVLSAEGWRGQGCWCCDGCCRLRTSFFEPVAVLGASPIGWRHRRLTIGTDCVAVLDVSDVWTPVHQLLTE